MTIKKMLWYGLGMLCLGMAYIGFVTPGIPFSIFLVGAAACFSRSSERMHKWLYSHPWFGEFLTNWEEKKVFPTRFKYVMIAMMSTSLAFLWFTSGNLTAVAWSGGFMLLVALWAWKYPGSVEEHQRRKDAGIKVGWFS